VGPRLPRAYLPEGRSLIIVSEVIVQNFLRGDGVAVCGRYGRPTRLGLQERVISNCAAFQDVWSFKQSAC